MKSLEQMVLEIEKEMKNVEFLPEIFALNPSKETQYYLLDTSGKTDYYKALAAFQQLYLKDGQKKILDLGTYKGGSVCALHASNLFGNSILTVDVDLSHMNLDLLSLADIDYLLVDESFISEEDFSRYDFIFVDIGHDGKSEQIVHHRIKETGYRGYVFYDDIKLNEEMKEFWDSIEEDKIETNWHFSGFGVVHYE